MEAGLRSAVSWPGAVKIRSGTVPNLGTSKRGVHIETIQSRKRPEKHHLTATIQSDTTYGCGFFFLDAQGEFLYSSSRKKQCPIT